MKDKEARDTVLEAGGRMDPRLLLGRELVKLRFSWDLLERDFLIYRGWGGETCLAT